MAQHKHSVNAVTRSSYSTPVKSSSKSPLRTAGRPSSSLASAYTPTTSASPNPYPQVSQSIPKDVGFVSSSTEYYYLVKLQNQWVSVIKQNLRYSDGSPVPVTVPFASLKMRKVKILQPGVYTSCAQLLDGLEDAEGHPGVQSLPKLPVAGTKDRLKLYEELSLRLMTNVVAISRSMETTEDMQGTNELLIFERPKISKRVLQLVEVLKKDESDRGKQTERSFTSLLHNFAEARETVCEMCHRGQFEVRLRCGHLYCQECKQKLVQKVLRGAGQVACFLCSESLSKVDQRLVALEKYSHRHKEVIKDEDELETARGPSPPRRHARISSQGAEVYCRGVVCRQCTEVCAAPAFLCPVCKASSNMRILKSHLGE